VKPVEDKDYVQSLDRGLSVILAFSGQHRLLTLGQLADITGLSRPTVRRLVLTLVRLGYVREEGRAFALTPHVLALGHAFTSSLNLTEVAQPHMAALAEATGHTCSLAALDGADAVFVIRMPSNRHIGHVLVTGTRLPAFATAIGRVLVAGLPAGEVELFLRLAPFPQLTATTVTTADQLRAILAEVRAQGWALVDQEFEEGVRSLSAPVRDSRDRVVAALGMSVPAGTVTMHAIRCDYLPALVGAADEISSSLGARCHPAATWERTVHA
jgi:IclR family pca regulon transcriptional regulator